MNEKYSKMSLHDFISEMHRVFKDVPPVSIVRESMKDADTNFKTVFLYACHLLRSCEHGDNETFEKYFDKLENLDVDVDCLLDKLDAFMSAKAEVPIVLRHLNPFFSSKANEHSLILKQNPLWMSERDRNVYLLNYSLYKNLKCIERAQDNIKRLKSECSQLYPKENKTWFYEKHDELVLTRMRLKGFQKLQKKFKYKLKEFYRGENDI